MIELSEVRAGAGPPATAARATLDPAHDLAGLVVPDRGSASLQVQGAGAISGSGQVGGGRGATGRLTMMWGWSTATLQVVREGGWPTG